MWLNSITLLPWLPGFPPKAFPITIFSLTSPRSVSLQSTVTITLGLLHTPQTPAPSRCTLQGTLISVRGMYGCGKDVWFSFYLGCHRSAVSLSALNVSPLTHTIAKGCGDQTPASVPQCERADVVLLILLFSPLVPLSYRVLRGSMYSFPLVKYSCPLSPGVLYALLYLKVYSWCICGERYTPSPPTPPACSPKFSHPFHKFEHFHFLD